MALGLGLTEAGPAEVPVAWGEGLKGLLTFMAQIALTLVTAHALAHTDTIRAALAWLGASILPARPPPIAPARLSQQSELEYAA